MQEVNGSIPFISTNFAVVKLPRASVKLALFFEGFVPFV